MRRSLVAHSRNDRKDHVEQGLTCSQEQKGFVSICVYPHQETSGQGTFGEKLHLVPQQQLQVQASISTGAWWGYSAASSSFCNYVLIATYMKPLGELPLLPSWQPSDKLTLWPASVQPATIHPAAPPPAGSASAAANLACRRASLDPPSDSASPPIYGCLSGQGTGSWISVFPTHPLLLYTSPSGPCHPSSEFSQLFEPLDPAVHPLLPFAPPVCPVCVPTSTGLLCWNWMFRFFKNTTKLDFSVGLKCLNSKMQEIQENMKQMALSRFKCNINSSKCPALLCVHGCGSPPSVAPSCAPPVFVHSPPHLSGNHFQTSYMVYVFVSQPKYLWLKRLICMAELSTGWMFFFPLSFFLASSQQRGLLPRSLTRWRHCFTMQRSWTLSVFNESFIFWARCMNHQLSVYLSVICH